MQSAEKRTHRTLRAAAKAWGEEVGVVGKRGSTYLYTREESGRLKPYRPYWTGGRSVQGYQQLGRHLEDKGILIPVYESGTGKFLGYRRRGEDQ